MTDPVQAPPGRLFPDVEAYVLQRTKEFDQISVERKAELQQLANYVGGCIAKGQDAKLTFICTHNSRRSQLSQIWTQIAATYYEVNHVQTFSGGTEVTACNPRTVAALKRCGVRFSVKAESSSNPHYAVAFSDMEPPLICFSRVFHHPPNPTANYCAIMTCSHADQNCPVVSGCDLRLAIPYEDPKVSDDTPQEAATYDRRCAQISREMLYSISRVKG
ncbi:MAG: protein-tyrosine-phosphatase [Planctomycetaceae bacterium]|nr:protein-tyrosine-phosphatase [Planctomycetaceae bacterium]